MVHFVHWYLLRPGQIDYVRYGDSALSVKTRKELKIFGESQKRTKIERQCNMHPGKQEKKGAFSNKQKPNTTRGGKVMYRIASHRIESR
jgi:hypothetical protein